MAWRVPRNKNSNQGREITDQDLDRAVRTSSTCYAYDS